MAVDGPAIGDPRLEEPTTAIQERVSEPLDLFDRRRVDDRPAKCSRRLRVFALHRAVWRQRCRRVALTASLRSAVEGGHLVGRSAGSPGRGRPGLDEVGQATLARHATHHDEVVAHHAIGVEHVGHAEVDVRGEAAVQLDLPVADRFSERRGCGSRGSRDRPAS